MPGPRHKRSEDEALAAELGLVVELDEPHAAPSCKRMKLPDEEPEPDPPPEGWFGLPGLSYEEALQRITTPSTESVSTTGQPQAAASSDSVSVTDSDRAVATFSYFLSDSATQTVSEPAAQPHQWKPGWWDKAVEKLNKESEKNEPQDVVPVGNLAAPVLVERLGNVACSFCLSALDKLIVDKIVEFCATCPKCKHNGIAMCNRYTNICWRQMHHRLTLSFARSISRMIHFENQKVDAMIERYPEVVHLRRGSDLLFFDLVDIMGLPESDSDDVSTSD